MARLESVGVAGSSGGAQPLQVTRKLPASVKRSPFGQDVFQGVSAASCAWQHFGVPGIEQREAPAGEVGSLVCDVILLVWIRLEIEQHDVWIQMVAVVKRLDAQKLLEADRPLAGPGPL